MKKKRSSLLCIAVLIAIVAVNLISNVLSTRAAASQQNLQEIWHTAVIDSQTANVSQLTVSKGKIYGTTGNTLFGVDEKTGGIVWEKTLSTAFGHVAPVVASGKIYAYNQGAVHVFDATNDQANELWSKHTGYGLTVDNGVLYTGSTNTSNATSQNIYAYNASSGQLIWQQSYNCPTNNNHPVIANGIEYLEGCYVDNNTTVPNILALNIKDGSRVWAQPGMLGANQNPTESFVNSTYAYTGLYQVNKATAYHASDGSTAWTVQSNLSNPIATENIVYMTGDISGSPTVYALDAATGKELWHQSKPLPSNNYNFFVTVANGTVYARIGATIYAFDGATGNELFEDATITSGTINAELFNDNGTLFLQKDSGGYVIYAYSQQQAITPTPSPSASETASQSPTATQTASPTSTTVASPMGTVLADKTSVPFKMATTQLTEQQNNQKGLSTMEKVRLVWDINTLVRLLVYGLPHLFPGYILPGWQECVASNDANSPACYHVVHPDQPVPGNAQA